MTWGARSVEVRFGRRTALRDVSLDVAPGVVTCVVGGDGAGKTTLLRLMAGALEPSLGTVERPAKAATGYVAAGSGLYPDLTAVENLAFAASVYGLDGALAARRIDELLDDMALRDAARRAVGALSGGMRQKLAVARALLHRPALLVLDEPTTGVDPVSRADVWALVASAAADGAAVLLATTYVDEAARAQHVLLLDEGEALASGSPEAVVAAMPGRVVVSAREPLGAERARSWRRGRTWRCWEPVGGGGRDAAEGSVAADLADAVVVAGLAREAATARRAGR